MAKFTAQRSWRRWHGTVADLCEAARAAKREIEGWDRGPVGVNVDIEFNDGIDADGLTLDDFERMPASDLPRIKMVEIAVGERYGVPGARIRAFVVPALKLEVRAADRSRAHGLREHVGSMLDPGGARWLGGWRDMQAAFALLILAVGSLVAVAILGASQRVTPVGLLILLVLPLAFVVTALSLPSLLPQLELLMPHQRTRARRFGAILVAFMIAVASGVVASLIFGLLH